MRSASRCAVFLVAPDRARLSRLCRWWPRSCSRCVPAGSSVFAFLHEIAASLARSTRLYRVIVTEILELTPIPPHGASGGQSVTYIYIWLLNPQSVMAPMLLGVSPHVKTRSTCCGTTVSYAVPQLVSRKRLGSRNQERRYFNCFRVFETSWQFFFSIVRTTAYDLLAAVCFTYQYTRQSNRRLPAACTYCCVTSTNCSACSVMWPARATTTAAAVLLCLLADCVLLLSLLYNIVSYHTYEQLGILNCKFS